MKFALILVAAIAGGCGGNDNNTTDSDLATSSPGDMATSASADLSHHAGGDLAGAPGDLAGASGDLATSAAGDMAKSASVSFATDVKPLLSNYGCFSHHMTSVYNPVESLATNSAIISFFTSTKTAECGADLFVKAGDSAGSYLFQKISGSFNAPCGASSQMPLNGTPMTSTEQALIKKWIDEGANDN